MRLAREVWPVPDPAVVEELRRLGLGRSVFTRYGDHVCFTFARNTLGLSAEGGFRLDEGREMSFTNWPPLLGVDPCWRAASMYTAYATSVEEQLLLPVAYKALWVSGGGVVGPDGRGWMWPRRLMGPAQCGRIGVTHRSPDQFCECGFHAAYSIAELASNYGAAGGILVVTPVGKTMWHENAWRAAGYQVHAAIVPLDWEVPEDWDPEVPIVRTRVPLAPYRAYEVAREVWTMLELEGEALDVK